MRILLANSYFYPAVGGIETYLLNVGRELIDRGHEVSVLAMRHDPSLPDRDSLDGIQIYRYEFDHRRGSLSIIDPLRRYRRSQRAFKEFVDRVPPFDVVWARDFYSLAGALTTSLPVVFIHAVAYRIYADAVYADDQHARVDDRLYRLLMRVQARYWEAMEKRALLAASARVTVSRAKRAEITHHYGLPDGSYEVVHPGVDTTRFRPVDAVQKRELRRRLGLDPDAFVFLYVGRFTAEKNPQGVLDAYARLPRSLNATLAMVGPAPGTMRKEHENDPTIILPGAIADPVDWYQCADAYVLPSLTEGFGIVLAEAMASGLPIIAFAPPDGAHMLATAEIIDSEETGLLVPYRDVAALGHAMVRLAGRPDLARTMGRRARARCEQRFSWARTTDDLLQVTASVIVSSEVHGGAKSSSAR